MSHVAAAACPPADGPVLGATAHEDRIVLNWMKPYWVNWMNEITILDWTLMRRAVDPDGTYQEIQLPLYPPWKDTGMFVDVDVIPGVDYFYYVYFTYQDGSDGGRNHISSRSEIVDAKTVNPRPIIGPMDVVFIQDNTQSPSIKMAFDKFRTTTVVDAIMDAIESASGGDYRLALVTTDNNKVNVRLNLDEGSRNRKAFKEALQGTPDVDGAPNFEESTDECLNTVVNALNANDRSPGRQENDFNPPFGLDLAEKPAFGWDANGDSIVPRKIIVLITDDAPGGFDDQYSSVAAGNALLYAQQARDQGIQINAILMDGAYWWSASSSLMLDYAISTCGWFSFLNSYGDNVQEAILSMFGVPITCSEFIYE